MSLLTFVVPWILLSLIATPFVGAIIARCLGLEDDLAPRGFEAIETALFELVGNEDFHGVR